MASSKKRPTTALSASLDMRPLPTSRTFRNTTGVPTHRRASASSHHRRLRSLLLGEVHAEPGPITTAEHARVVALAGRIVEQTETARPEAPRFPIAGRDLHLA